MPLQSRPSASRADAARNQQRFRQAGVFAVNIVGGLGSGKTALVDAALKRLVGRREVGVISASPTVGAGHATAERYAEAAAVRHVATGGGPWLTAAQVRGALEGLPLDSLDLLLIENLGSYGPGPAAPDLGQDAPICVLSVLAPDGSAGDDCDGGQAPALVVFNKIDLLPMMGLKPSPSCREADGGLRASGVIETSARTGEGVGELVDWLLTRCSAR
jgi:hydrogenase nickel incorporation protein HypB